VSSTRLNQFFETSVSKASKEVIQYETIINGMLTRIEKSNIVKESSNHAINFEQQRMDAHSSQSQLIADQKKAFVDFKDALKQVASRLLTVSMMYDKMDQMQNMHNLAQSTHTDVGNVAYFKAMGQLSSKVDPVYLEDLYTKMNGLYGQRNSKEFADNNLLKELSKLKGQEHLIENLRKETDPDRFATMLIQSMAQGNKENAGVFAEAIKKQFGDDAAVFAFLTDLRIKLENIETVAKARKDPSNIDPNNISLQADNIAQGVSKNAQPVLNAGFNRSKEQLQKDKTDMASTAQSAPALNAWNNFFEYVMRAHPEISKTFESIGALGSALDDIVGVAKPIVGGFLAMRVSTMAFTLSTTSLSSLAEGMSARFAAAIPGIRLVATRLTAFGTILLSLWEAAKTAASTTTDGVNGMYGSIAAPRAQTPEEAAETKARQEKIKQEDWNRNAPYMSLVNQNMMGQKMVFDSKNNEYQYMDTKTGKIANMGGVGGGLDEIKHASDEWEANAKKRKEYEEKTGTKIMMAPKDRGWFHKQGSIEFVAVDADGNQVANFGRKLKIPKSDMVDKTAKWSYKRYPQQGSLSTVSQAYPPPPMSEAVKSSIKDQSVNQGLSMDMNKIKEQMSTSMQLSRQLLNTPSTMQQRFNFYFTLPQNNSGKLEHSFDNNAPISRRGNGSVVSLDRKFPQIATPFKA